MDDQRHAENPGYVEGTIAGSATLASIARIPDYITVRDLPSGRRYEVRVETTGADGRRQQSRRRFRTVKEATDYYTGVTSDRSRGTHVAPPADDAPGRRGVAGRATNPAKNHVRVRHVAATGG